MVSIPPTGESKESYIKNEVKAPFFLQKGPSCKTSRRDILQFTSENAPYGWSVPPIAMGGQGSSPWTSPG